MSTRFAHQIAELVEGREAPNITQTQQSIDASIRGVAERFIVAFMGTGIAATQQSNGKREVA